MKELLDKIRNLVKIASRESADQANKPLLEQLHALQKALYKARKDQQLTLQSLLADRWRKEPNRLESRLELPHWLNFMGLYGEGVEIGVFQGDFSLTLLETWRGKRLHSIDPWRSFDPEEFVDVCNVQDDVHQRYYEKTCKKLAGYKERSNVIRKTSEEAAADFEDASLDFIYIDAQHHYEAVVQDIELWRPKVKPGGVFGGHDYLDGLIDSGLYGVKQAADEFAKREELELITTNDGPYPSWFVIV